MSRVPLEVRKGVGGWGQEWARCAGQNSNTPASNAPLLFSVGVLQIGAQLGVALPLTSLWMEVLVAVI